MWAQGACAVAGGWRSRTIWLSSVALLDFYVVSAQICNSRDPEGGGMLIPAFGYGSDEVCLGTARDPDWFKNRFLTIYTNQTFDVTTNNICAFATQDDCVAHGMDQSDPVPLCSWDMQQNTCAAREVYWGCECVEYQSTPAEQRDPDSENYKPCAPAENDPQAGMAIIYLVFLAWTFMGVGIIADVFMEAIAVITSSSKLVEQRDEKTGDKTQLEIMSWNATVANLTLMALGSSAPEILLSVIEIFNKKYLSGDLGPSTIVGSAAFNMLVILGICVLCIPPADADNGETGTRKIDDMGVFAITAFFSIFAYIWLLIILMVSSPNVVTLFEAALTLGFVVVLVVLAWAADKGYFSRQSKVAPEVSVVGTRAAGGDVAIYKPSEVKNLLKKDGHREALHRDPEELARMAYFEAKPKNRADYRIEATRALTGSRPLHENAPLQNGVTKRSWVAFSCTEFHVSAEQETIDLTFERTGCADYPVSVQYNIETPTEVTDSEASKQDGTVTFAAGETQHVIKVPTHLNKDDRIVINMVSSEASPSDKNSEIESERATAIITLNEDDSPATVFMAETDDVHEDGHSASYKCFESDGRVVVKVVRSGSCLQPCTLSWATKEDTATADIDYEAVGEKENEVGKLEFGVGEASKYLTVVIIDDDQYENDECFTVSLIESEDAVLGGLKVALVTIVNDDEMTETIEKVAALLSINLDKYKAGGASWKAQFNDAIEFPDGIGNQISHVINMPWKVAFAICPPPGLCSGWLCFFVSLGLIGVVTAIIGDVAALFGCAVGMKNEFTAITFVALGTSLPDTFASKAAAIGDKNADASVGNVTGSNSVNVFLGLGLPWLIAAVFWTAAESDGSEDHERWIDYLYGKSGLNLGEISDVLDVCDNQPCFVVPAGDLGFSVIVFSCCGCTCLGGMILRRSLFGAELGGSAKIPFGCLFIGLWFLYVTLSGMQIYEVF